MAAILRPSATSPGNPVVAADTAVGTGASRANDRLSPVEFLDPPVHARPGCFWDWLNGSITREQITRDLEAMKRGGMRGGEIWDVAAHADPDKRVPAGPAFLGPESTRLIAHAIREADRFGLETGIVASSGWNAGGSWIQPEHAGKALYHSATTVTGPVGYHGKLPLPDLPKRCPRNEAGQPVYLREVAVLAVPGQGSDVIVSPERVVDLTELTAADGTLRWETPPGEWTVLRFVCANHGQQLIVPSPNSGGPMIDFFDPRATEFHLHHIVTTILRELGRPTFAGSSFKTLEFDSMELDGFTPWNETMAAEFQRRAGYPARAYCARAGRLENGGSGRTGTLSLRLAEGGERAPDRGPLRDRPPVSQKIRSQPHRRIRRPRPADLELQSGRCHQGSRRGGYPARRILDPEKRHLPGQGDRLGRPVGPITPAPT